MTRVTGAGLEPLLQLVRQARAARAQGRPVEAHRLLDEVEAGRRRSRGLSPAARMVAGGWSALERGRLHAAAGDLACAQEQFEDAAVLAREAGADDLLVEALHQQALVEPVGHFAVRLLRRALDVVQGSADAALADRAGPLRVALAQGYERTGRPEEAARARSG